MSPLRLLVHADSPDNAARIERALRAGAPSCAVEIVTDANALPNALARQQADGVVAAPPEATPPAANTPSMTPALRHELNNHLALIRMLADFLADEKSLSAAARAKVQEIGSAAEAAAQAVRRTKPTA